MFILRNFIFVNSFNFRRFYLQVELATVPYLVALILYLEGLMIYQEVLAVKLVIMVDRKKRFQR